MDIELLTKVVEKQSYADGDLQNPEGMATETLVAHLSRMNIAYPNSTRSREGLLYLFRVHIQPKTQRNRFWRRKRRREEVEVGDTWTTGMDCDNRTRKREYTGDDSNAPATKRMDIEGTGVVAPRALPIEALNIRTTPESVSNRRIIKIKRNSSFRGNNKDKVVPPEKDHTNTSLN
jgi:hypothetical protein